MAYLNDICTKTKEMLNAEMVICHDYEFRKDDFEMYRIRKVPPADNDRTLHDLLHENAMLTQRLTTALCASAIISATKRSKNASTVGAVPQAHQHQCPATNVRHCEAETHGFLQPVYRAVRGLNPDPDPCSADNQGELCWLRHDERQEWLWLSNRTPEETILILSYDSDVGEGPSCVPHNSFGLPNAPPEAPVRESLEARLIVLSETADESIVCT